MKYGNVFTQIMMFSLKKVDDLRAREREREEKGITNSAPMCTITISLPLLTQIQTPIW